jgi:hypothetical protein
MAMMQAWLSTAQRQRHMSSRQIVIPEVCVVTMMFSIQLQASPILQWMLAQTSSSDSDDEADESHFGLLSSSTPFHSPPTLFDVMGTICSSEELQLLQEACAGNGALVQRLSRHFPVIGTGQCGCVVRIAGCALKAHDMPTFTSAEDVLQLLVHEAASYQRLSGLQDSILPKLYFAGHVCLPGNSTSTYIVVTEYAGTNVEQILCTGRDGPPFPSLNCSFSELEEQQCSDAAAKQGGQFPVDLLSMMLSCCGCLECRAALYFSLFTRLASCTGIRDPATLHGMRLLDGWSC